MFELPLAAALFCILVVGAFIALWLGYDARDHRHFEGERRKTTFHCIRCDRLYTAPSGTALCLCPRCGHENARLRF